MPLCPSCDTALTKTEAAAGKCPRCGSKLPEPRPTARESERAAKTSAAVEKRASRAGCLAVVLFVIVLVNTLNHAQSTDKGAGEAEFERDRARVAMALIAGGLVLGLVGLTNGIKTRSTSTIVWAGVGTLLNGYFVVYWIRIALFA